MPEGIIHAVGVDAARVECIGFPGRCLLLGKNLVEEPKSK